ncbi:tetratricopeptide repeat protein [Aestuariivirga litoralis]|uniref:tetratricopeptide repeat-containing glycosyltransferase family protein n=1 Tax=Aestuariivirga litoralis TaxID=2650924 RepID=UPI00137B1620|nr:tetratricopeptide repeat-containing glycosyltransferase family protein [Aestuariivirga litoralis]
MTAPNDIFQKALALHQRGQAAAAQALYAQVLALEPGHFDSLHLMGLTFIQAGEPARGVELIRRAIALRSGFAEAHYNLGNALLTLGRPGEALESFTTALKLKPDDAQYHLEAGNALKDLKRNGEAVAAYDAAIRLDPTLAEAFNNRGIALKDEGRPDAALASYDAAIRLRPRYAEAHSNRGNVLKELGRHGEALACHDAAIALRPGYAEAHYNRANVLGEMKRHDEALASYDEALRLRPGYAEAEHNKAQLLLGMGRLKEGFARYHWRWKSPAFTGAAPRTGLPAWRGETGGHVLLWGEQGIGDEIFHASMLSLLPHGMSVTVAADARLRGIYERSFPGLRLIASSDLEQALDEGLTAQAAMGDLGAILGVDDTTIAARRMPYLVADDARLALLRRDNPVLLQQPVCGLSWKSANKRFGAEKSLRLIDLAPLLQTEGVTFVNLQYGEVADEIAEVRDALGVRVHEVAGLDVFNDIDGLLALVAGCDGVLTTSNVTAHLAGALARPGVVLVPTGKGCLWYWQGGANNLWYPSLRRVAQQQAGQWQAAIHTAVASVKDIL